MKPQTSPRSRTVTHKCNGNHPLKFQYASRFRVETARAQERSATRLRTPNVTVLRSDNDRNLASRSASMERTHWREGRGSISKRFLAHRECESDLKGSSLAERDNFSATLYNNSGRTFRTNCGRRCFDCDRCRFPLIN